MVSSVQRWLASALVLTGVIAGSVDAQSGQISGRVTDAGSGTPVADVRVEARSGGTVRNALTTPSGTYRIAGLPDGQYVVSFSRIGYAAAADTVSVSGGGSVTVDITLSADAARRRHGADGHRDQQHGGARLQQRVLGVDADADG